MIKYSIIIPVYQCKKYLEQCVSSVLNQSNGNFEILLVDDGSSDGSAALAEALSNQSDKIRVFHKENGGAASARNRGILEAKGQFLLFLDCDDTIENTLLEDLEKNQDIREEELIIFGMSFDYYRGGSLERSELLSCAYAGKRMGRC